jgi:endoglycosylceramidase
MATPFFLLLSLLIVATCSLLVAHAVSTPLPRIALKQIQSGRRVFVEADSGREIIFHGVNTIVKGIPYVPSTDVFDVDTSLTDEDHALLADLGVNIYRLGAMWPGVEPERGQYNATYISELNKIVAAAGNHGIYTILDMHQDVFSERYCGEGVPYWAAITSVDNERKNFPFPLTASYTDVASDGFPTRSDCAKFNWPQYYNTFAAGSGFESLFQNKSGLMDSWSNYWRHLAATVGSGNTAVIGYELMNEPMGGDGLSNPKLYVPSVADRTVLQPAYDTITKAIRQEDQDGLVIFAAITWDDFVPVGFTAAPGGPEEAYRSAFAFHYYEPPQFVKEVDFHQRMADADRLQTGAILTEFERPTPDDDVINDKFVIQADLTDKYGLSWTLWEYKTFCKETAESLASDSQQAAFGSCKTGYGEKLFVDENGKRLDAGSKKLARTYAQATAGRLQTMKFNATTGDFVAQWKANTDITRPTEIFAHQELNYPTGMVVDVFPPLSMTWEMKSANIVAFYYTPLAKNSDMVTVKISRK